MGVDSESILESCKRDAYVWSAERDDEMIRLSLSGITDDEIGEIMGRSIDSIRARRYLLKLKKPLKKAILYSDDLIKRARHLWNVEKKSAREVGNELGLTIGQVSGIARRNKFDARECPVIRRPIVAIAAIPRPLEPEVAKVLSRRDDRPPLPPGAPESWGAIIRGTCLEGIPYPL
jgi:hypothetical protein